MKQYKYILLDWDGNLARTLDIWLAALRTSLKKRGHNFTDEQIGANFTVFQERMNALGIQDVDAMIIEADRAATKDAPYVELYPDAMITLEALHKAGKKVALVTTSRHNQVDQLLEKHKIQDFFDAVVCGDDVSNHKPHAEPLERAIKLLGGNIHEAVMVGDSESDVLGAANAGVDSILFFPPEHARFYDIEKLKQLKPTYVIANFSQLLTL